MSEIDWNFIVFVTDGKGKKQIYINGHLREELTSAAYSGTGNNAFLGRCAVCMCACVHVCGTDLS
jgi:hypothetical protein